jgi:predicted XRE-type DNA-binding protein
VAISIIQVQLDALIDRTGMNDRELGALLDVAQSTAWRLRNGKIHKVDDYVQALREHLGNAHDARPVDDIDLVNDLVALSTRVPAVKDALLALRRIMHGLA